MQPLTWFSICLGVDAPAQKLESATESLPDSQQLRGAETDAQLWHSRVHSFSSEASLLRGTNANFNSLCTCLGDAIYDRTPSLLITFSGFGTTFKRKNARSGELQQAICMSDIPVTPEMLSKELRKASRISEIVLVLDTSFALIDDCIDDGFRDAVFDIPQSLYARVRNIKAKYLLETDHIAKASRRGDCIRKFSDLPNHFDNVKVVLADRRYAWETSTNQRDYHKRSWHGVFSYAAQHAMDFGAEHLPWKQLAVTQRLIPTRFFPQHPVLCAPTKSSRPSTEDCAVR